MLILRFLLVVATTVGVASSTPANQKTPSVHSSASVNDKAYNILFLLPFSSISHRNVHMPLATELAKRGHHVTMLANDPIESHNPNITYLLHDLPYFRPEAMGVNTFQEFKDEEVIFKRFKEEIYPLIGRDFYRDAVVKDLYERRDTFDVFVIDQFFNEVAYLFAHNKPLITLSTTTLDPYNSALMGNLQNPAYVPNYISSYATPLSIFNRVHNLVFTMLVPIFWKSSIREPAQIEISRQFPSMPSLLELEKQQDLNLINGHFSFDAVYPLLPNQVEVGGMHLRPGKPLPKVLESFIAGPTPVIYFSLGSIMKSKDISDGYKKILLSAFAKLPYKVLWKYEEEGLENVPKNVLIQKWMPQQDVLAHPNVKVFISHCGLLGTQEAVYNGKPMLGMPFFGDQPKNAKKMARKGFGRYIKWDDLSEKLLIENLEELITNPKYAAVAAEISRHFSDQMTSPVDRAAFWVEYVARHRGAKHLRSPAADLSWIQILHIDIVVCVYVVAILLYIMFGKVLGQILGLFFRFFLWSIGCN